MDPLALRVAAAYLLKNPHEELRGETIEASKISEYERELKKAERAAKQAKIKADGTPSGKAKGMAKNEERKANREARLAAARLEIAKQLKKKGMTKAKF